MKHPKIIKEIEEYCEATNLKPSTVCVRAIENSRFYEREIRRAEQLEAAAQRIRDYISDNPPVHENEAAAQ